MPDKINVLYINSHDTGRYVQPYGYAIPTPNIQKLAERGVLFRQAFNGGPTCSASRAALLTGQYPHCSGMLGLAHRGFSLNDPTQHLAHTMKQNGYHTILSGVQHVAVGEKLKRIGYDAIIGNRETAHTAAVEFLNNKPQQPFYLEVGFFETHRVFPERDPDIDPDRCRPPAVIADTPETREDMARFCTSAQELDRKMGEVFDALEKTGLAKNTLVVCTTDHGVAFPTMKCNLTDHGMGVMLIMAGPKPFAGGRAVDAMVSQIDIFPTLCDYLGLEKPKWLQGVSVMPVIYGEQDEVRDELFCEVTYHAAYEPMRCVRTKRWKYIKRFDGRARRVLSNVDDGITKSFLLENGWKDQPMEEEQLFDLVFDPEERNNVADVPANKAMLDEMRKRLEDYMKRTNDPLLDGPVPAPKGASINDPDQLSPNEPVTKV